MLLGLLHHLSDEQCPPAPGPGRPGARARRPGDQRGHLLRAAPGPHLALDVGQRPRRVRAGAGRRSSRSPGESFAQVDGEVVDNATRIPSSHWMMRMSPAPALTPRHSPNDREDRALASMPATRHDMSRAHDRRPRREGRAVRVGRPRAGRCRRPCGQRARTGDSGRRAGPRPASARRTGRADRCRDASVGAANAGVVGGQLRRSQNGAMPRSASRGAKPQPSTSTRRSAYALSQNDRGSQRVAVRSRGSARWWPARRRARCGRAPSGRRRPGSPAARSGRRRRRWGTAATCARP